MPSMKPQKPISAAKPMTAGPWSALVTMTAATPAARPSVPLQTLLADIDARLLELESGDETGNRRGGDV